MRTPLALLFVRLSPGRTAGHNYSEMKHAEERRQAKAEMQELRRQRPSQAG
jgi:hypothetical protein